MRIEICGGIGSGKTTLTKLLGQNGFTPILENFSSNPFWAAFYTDPNKYQFETEITFLLQHYHQIKTLHVDKSVCDFSFYQDFAYAKMGLTGKRLEIFNDILLEAVSEFSNPSLLICLDCESSILLERIHKRNRKEEETINVGFLDLLNEYIYKEVSSFSLYNRVLHINSELINFSSDIKGQEFVLQNVSDAIYNN